MRFSASILSMLIASVAAQTAGFDAITSPTNGESFTTGETVNIIWDSTVNAPITITLLQGASQSSLETGDAVASSIQSSLGTYAWTIPSSAAGFATYGFKLTLDSNPSTFQYSFPFKIAAGSSSSSVSGSVSASASASASSSASSVSGSVSATSSSSATTTVKISSVSPTASVSSTIQNSSSTVSATTSAVVAIVTGSSNSTGNSTFTSSSPSAATGATLTTQVVTTASSTSESGSSSTSTKSSGAFRNMAVTGLSLVGAIGFSIAMIM